jgi:hypothetical protein
MQFEKKQNNINPFTKNLLGMVNYYKLHILKRYQSYVLN